MPSSSKKSLSILNLVFIIGVIAWNGYVATHSFKGNTIDSLSNKYDTLLTPATYAFGIWSLIFISLLALGFAHVYFAFKKGMDDQGVILNIGPWLMVANIFNGLWIFVWMNDLIFISVLVMIGLLASLIKIITKLQMEMYAVMPRTKIWTWAPISLYSGWITVALVVNISAYLTKMGFGQGSLKVIFAVLVLAIATSIYLYMLKNRNMWLYCLPGAWAFYTIFSKQNGETNNVVHWLALAASVVLIFSSIMQINKLRSASKPTMKEKELNM